MLLLGEELTSLARSDEFFSIDQSYGQVESSSESFAHQHARRRVVATDALVDLLRDVLALISRYALHAYSRSSTPHVELVPDYYVGLGSADELLSLVLVGGNLLLADIVNEGLSLVHVDHHDLLTKLRRHRVSGRWRRL
jgi:energy-converting hydrogenase A subunit M